MRWTDSMRSRTGHWGSGGLQRLNNVNFIICTFHHSVVSIPTGYGLNDRGFGVQVPVGSRIFSSSRRPDRLWGPLNLLSNGYRGALSPGVMRPGREPDHSPPSSAEFTKIWSYTFTSTIRLHGVVFILISLAQGQLYLLLFTTQA
jgi:hypothetical protein